jgi:hypothetical protein
MIWPLSRSLLYSAAGSRFQGTSIFYSREGEKQPINRQLVLKLSANYLSHYTSSFLFLGGSQNFRMQLKKVGPLLLIEAPFLLLGLAFIIKRRKQKWAQFLLCWLLIGPAAAAIGFEAPHQIRAFNMLPALIIITALGVYWLKPKINSLAAVLLLILFIFNSGYFLLHYFQAFPVYAAPDWQYGYQQATEIAASYENKVNKIVFTSHYGQPYIFTLVYQNRDPQAVFWGAMSKYLYRQINWEEDKYLQNVLLIGSAAEIPANATDLIREINFPNGEVAFRIVKTPTAP